MKTQGRTQPAPIQQQRTQTETVKQPPKSFGTKAPAKGQGTTGFDTQPVRAAAPPQAFVQQRVQPGWMGNTSVVEAREPTAPSGADRFTFGTWERQRASDTRFFFEVWAPGVTDRENPDLWRQLDVEVHYKYEGDADFKTDYVNFDARSGNNARYAIDLRKYDPWSEGGLTQGHAHTATHAAADGEAEAKMSFYFTVNGAELKRPDGSPYEGTYRNYEP